MFRAVFGSLISLALFATLGVLSGCASQTARESEAPSQGSVPAPKRRTTSDASAQASGCVDLSSSSAGLSLHREGKTKIEGESLLVYTGRNMREKSLCEVLRDSGKKAAIFQFAGWDCISCQDEAVEIRSYLRKSKYGKDIAHVVILTDLFEDVTDDKFKNFMNTYAPDSIAVYDESTLWFYFTKNRSKPDRATIMAMNINMDGYVYNTEGSQSKILTAAEELARTARTSTSSVD